MKYLRIYIKSFILGKKVVELVKKANIIAINYTIKKYKKSLLYYNKSI